MKIVPLIFRAWLCFSCLNLSGTVTNTSIQSMMNTWETTEPGRHNRFSLTGTIHTTRASDQNLSEVPCFVIDDGKRLISVFNKTRPHVRLNPGDHIVASGIFGLKKYTYGNEPYAIAYEIQMLNPGKAPPHPATRALCELCDISDNLRMIETTGTVIDWRTSEDDSNYVYLTLKDGATTMPVLIPSQKEEALNKLLDSQVKIIGQFNWALPSVRRYARPLIVSSLDDISLLRPPAPSWEIPFIERKIYQTPASIRSLGKRKVSGEIIAVWQKRNLLLRDGDGRIIRVKLSLRNRTQPCAGLNVTIAGYPETDQFNIILGTATIVSSSAGNAQTQHSSRLDSLTQVFNRNSAGSTLFNPSYYGKLITISGTIRNLPSLGNAEGSIGLDCGGHLVQLDTSSCPEATCGLELGCKIEAMGICLLETNDYDAQTDMPHISGLTIILRQKEDITILSHPPWLTPFRFLVILFAMAGILMLFLIWNAALRTLVERRGRELARKQIEATNAKFKTIERTRLATELHDSVVQNLTGAAMEIRAAQAALPANEEASAPHLDIALKTINSSRAELRNCIWDLRNQALEKSSIEEAIRITLQPHIYEARLNVAFEVPRRNLPDNEFHNILCIIRELVINAERHGQASVINVDGHIECDRLYFSVTDNGCGFDPLTRPRMEQGHFGLEGVLERVKALDGSVNIISAKGKGARIEIGIPLPKEKLP